MTPAGPPPFAAMEERVYAADLDDFVRERAAAAKELRGMGERGEAAAIAKLPKPSVAAWIVNRLARAEPGPMGELLDAGARLRDVQLGAGSAADLRDASQAQDDALRSLLRAAERVGGSATSATLERVRETLHAAALDAGLAEQVRRGVLVREQRAVGFPMGLAIPDERRRPVTAKPGPKSKPARKAAEPKRAAPRDEVAAKRRERAAAAAETAQAALAEAESDLASAQDDVDAAEAGVDDARRAVAAAERRERDARKAAERAARVHARAEGDAERALARLRELDERERG